MDLHQAFIHGIPANFPNAHLTIERFLVIKPTNEAVDQVHRREVKEHPTVERTHNGWLN